MRYSFSLAAAALLAVGASAENYLGFNSGATLADRSAKFKADFKAEFTTAQALAGSPGKFNAVRLYTNVQAYSKDDPIEAFEAAIETKTLILLGIWASGTDNIDNEISALKKAITKFGKSFTDLVIGVSIGSEDLYRISVTGIQNDSGVGNSPSALVKFIGDFKTAFANTALASTPVGHVDTWDVWVNGTNKPVVDAIDWVGVDEYPYYENGKGNNIKNSGQLFDSAFNAVVSAVNGRPVWVTETGWPSSGPAWDEAVASIDNAKYYWNEVGCRTLFGKVPTFWYNLRDSNPDNKMKFAITNNLATKPLFDLTCPTTFETPSKTTGNSTTSGSSQSSSSTGVATPSGTRGSAANAGSSSGSSTGSSSSAQISIPTSGAALAKTLSPGASLALVAGLIAALL